METRARAQRLLRPTGWVVLALCALALVAPISALASTDAGRRVTVATNAPGNRAATRTLLEADYKLLKATLVRVQATDAAMAGAAKALGHECRGVLRGVPEHSVIESEDSARSEPRLSGRTQGEQARSELEKQTIDLEISQTISIQANRLLRGPYDAYIATVDRLTWSNPTIAALVHQEATLLREDLAGPTVVACDEMRAWAASGFHLLPPASKRLEEAEQARSNHIVVGDLEVLLRPYEGPTGHVIIRRTEALTEQLREKERANEVEERAVNRLDRALGEKVSPFAEQRVAPAIGRGRTHAGSKFVIRASVGKSFFSGSCKHEVQIEVSEGHIGSIESVCLSERAHANPSSGCSGPIETIQLATPPDVRRARVRLSDGQNSDRPHRADPR